LTLSARLPGTIVFIAPPNLPTLRFGAASGTWGETAGMFLIGSHQFSEFNASRDRRRGGLGPELHVLIVLLAQSLQISHEKNADFRSMLRLQANTSFDDRTSLF
jgi:hypothetical protein